MKNGQQETLRFLITEDYASTRLGIKQILQDEFHPVVFGEAIDERETLSLLKTRNWDLMILDIGLPGRHGLEVLREVKRLRPALPVLIFSAHPEEQFAAHALRAHAAGYLTKERAPEELISAVRKILAGDRYISPSLAKRLAADLASGQASLPHEALSPREFQVMRLTASGKPGKTIAFELSLSQKTVSTYRTRIRKKLGFDSMAELVQYAVHHRLI
jgi:DNA-binding NarL/FixJ family response regulator